MTRVLIIEDQSPNYVDIKNDFEKYGELFDVFPKSNNDKDANLNNQGHLLDALLEQDENAFQAIVDYHTGIDLFIIDATLYQSMDDRIGIDFLNFLKRSNYKNGQYNFIITSQHNLDAIGNIEPDFDAEKQYVSKSMWGNKFSEEIVRKSIELLHLDTSTRNYQQTPENKISFWEKRWWILLPVSIEKQIIHRFNLFIFYILIVCTGLFALVGVSFESYNQLGHFRGTGNNDNNAKELLEYVEHIFLYLLPLFVVFSFLSYYKSTIEIRLTGGNTRDIDHDGAMKSLDNSKLILLSSLFSFTIIKIIDKLFIIGEKNIISLISYGIFVLILIAFILLQHKNAHK